MRFGPYVLGELLGAGGMGEVYRAHDVRRDRQVALKLLPDGVAVDEEYLLRFRREQQIAARCSDPHIVPIHDFGEIDGRMFLDMRLVEGRDVRRILDDDGPLVPARAVHLVSQVADALDAAHADDLVHRDIKPSNVLVTAKDFAYVADFGIARSIGDVRSPLTITGATVGTLAYMAPERFTEGPIDARVDVYSLACVLHECLTGRAPFAGVGLPGLLHAHLNLLPPRASELVPGVPAAFDDVIRRGMAKAPGDRYPSAGALAAAAAEALRATWAAPVPAPVTASAPGAVGRPTAAPPVPGTTYGSGSGSGFRPPPPPAPPTEWPVAPRSAAATAAPAAPAPPRRRSRALLVTLAVAMLVLAGVVGGLEGNAAQATTEAAGTPGDSPFMPSPGADGVAEPAVRNLSATVDGDTPGLYGGTRTDACDSAQIASFLHAHPDQAQAWAGVQGIAPSDIDTYLATLTPVTLRTDTAVTNHGFRNGAATTLHSVLQAGTGVLVDPGGVPRVRCYCGNPLGPPDPAADYPDTATTVRPAARPVSEFVVVRPGTGDVVRRPSGSHGDRDHAATHEDRERAGAVLDDSFHQDDGVDLKGAGTTPAEPQAEPPPGTPTADPGPATPPGPTGGAVEPPAPDPVGSGDPAPTPVGESPSGGDGDSDAGSRSDAGSGTSDSSDSGDSSDASDEGA